MITRPLLDAIGFGETFLYQLHNQMLKHVHEVDVGQSL